ncbi:hypothetical protein BMAFMH_E0011, partial [Burkholderia mallei FMH]
YSTRPSTSPRLIACRTISSKIS